MRGKFLAVVPKSRGKRLVLGEYPDFSPMPLTREFSVDRVLECTIMRSSFFKCESYNGISVAHKLKL
jgi:hypothetical protein